MKKSKMVSFLLVCLSVLILSCEEMEELAYVKVTNASKYAEDTSVNMQLMQRNKNGGFEILVSTEVGWNKSITWTRVPWGVYLAIKVTDKNGKECSNTPFVLEKSETRKFKYDGTSISRVYE